MIFNDVTSSFSFNMFLRFCIGLFIYQQQYLTSAIFSFNQPRFRIKKFNVKSKQVLFKNKFNYNLNVSVTVNIFNWSCFI